MEKSSMELESAPNTREPDLRTHRQRRADALSQMGHDAQRYTRSGDGLPKADHLGHRTRGSDSSFYDERCVLCGGTDGNGDSSLRSTCPGAVDDIPTELEATLLDLSEWLEDAAVNLQAATPDGNNPAGYKGPHPCDCAHFAEDAMVLIRGIVSSLESTHRREKGYTRDEPSPLPVIPAIERGTADNRSPADLVSLQRLARRATPGNVAIGPFVYGADGGRCYLVAGVPSRVRGEGLSAVENFASDMTPDNAAYVVGLIRADRRLRREGFGIVPGGHLDSAE